MLSLHRRWQAAAGAAPAPYLDVLSVLLLPPFTDFTVLIACAAPQVAGSSR
jgi:hypothetical protein